MRMRSLRTECCNSTTAASSSAPQGKTVLVDTGMGPGPHAHLENRTGNLLGALREAGNERGRD